MSFQNTSSFNSNPTNNEHVVTTQNKRSRGRPPGSKNKPKPSTPSLPVSQSIESSANLVTVNVEPGKDMIETILDFGRQNHVSFTIFNAFGMIENVTLATSSIYSFHGPFTLLSFTGFYLYNDHYTLHTGATPPNTPFSFEIEFSTSRRQVLGGLVGGSVLAKDNVSVTLSTFIKPDIFRHIPDDEEGKDNDYN